jgi:hypothetical protein
MAGGAGCGTNVGSSEGMDERDVGENVTIKMAFLECWRPPDRIPYSISAYSAPVVRHQPLSARGAGITDLTIEECTAPCSMTALVVAPVAKIQR